ncbi:hypothetical protein PUN4_700070 [Paraburkholderia unamae]|nr:hypothetical protein PUN4_700070 [Paraburkholderia unamae]
MLMDNTAGQTRAAPYCKACGRHRSGTTDAHRYANKRNVQMNDCARHRDSDYFIAPQNLRNERM